MKMDELNDIVKEIDFWQGRLRECVVFVKERPCEKDISNQELRTLLQLANNLHEAAKKFNAFEKKNKEGK